MRSNQIATAIIWDYDGTLVDTRQKNFNVAKKIIKNITGKDSHEFPALSDIASYDAANKRATNWRDLYEKEYGLKDEKIDEAGKLWSEFQLNDETPTPVMHGIKDVLNALKQFPQGIVSQNARSSIAMALQKNGLAEYFQIIIGYEEVDLKKQKPEPDGLLMCVNELIGPRPAKVFFIGDHEVDIQCALRAREVITKNQQDIQILSIAALYGSHADQVNWKFHADFDAKVPQNIVNIVMNHT
ncbi:MAG: HAD family hydrolase [bacterium]